MWGCASFGLASLGFQHASQSLHLGDTLRRIDLHPKLQSEYNWTFKTNFPFSLSKDSKWMQLSMHYLSGLGASPCSAYSKNGDNHCTNSYLHACCGFAKHIGWMALEGAEFNPWYRPKRCRKESWSAV